MSRLQTDPAGQLIQDLRRTVDVNTGISSDTTGDDAVSAVEEGIPDLIAVGRSAIANLVAAGRELV